MLAADLHANTDVTVYSAALGLAAIFVSPTLPERMLSPVTLGYQ